MKVSLKGPQNQLSSQNICDTVNYIEKNLLSELGLHIGNVTIYFSTYDEHGNYVVPGIDQQGIAITHDYYYGEYLVDANPKESVPDYCFVPIDSILSEQGTLLPAESQIADVTRARAIKGIRETARMTVRQLEQLSGINGQIICEYERGVREIPSEDITAIKNVIHDFAEGHYQLPSIDSELAKIEMLYRRPLTVSEKQRMIEIIKIGMTDKAIQAAIEKTHTRHSKISVMNAYRQLMNWAIEGLYGGDSRYTPKHDSEK